MMHVIMLVQVMMQATGDGGVRDIASPFSDESHQEQSWVCLDTTSEIFPIFHGIC